MGINNKIGTRGKMIETDILGLGIDPIEMADVIEKNCGCVHAVRPDTERIVVVLDESCNMRHVEKQLEQIKLELYKPTCIRRRLYAIKQMVYKTDDRVEICFKESDWLHDASLISVVITLRGHSAIADVSLSNGVAIITPISDIDEVYDRVIKVLEDKAHHVRVYLPHD